MACIVLDDLQIVALSDGVYRIHVRGMTIEVNRWRVREVILASS
jgi:hypothetical protein